jgi:predicted O-methyltransferase YrrM
MRPALHYVLYRLRLAGAETQTTEAESDCIAHHARNRATAAEIGVWHGVTTCRIARALEPGGVLFAIDSYAPGRLGFSFQERIARRQTRHLSNRIRFVSATSATASVQLGETLGSTFDFVFLDGDHSYHGLAADWQAWSGLLSRGGVIALHDSRSTPARNIDDAGSVIFTGEVVLHDPRFEVLEQVESLTVMRRR